jgi:hypothetical protein
MFTVMVVVVVVPVLFHGPPSPVDGEPLAVLAWAPSGNDRKEY